MTLGSFHKKVMKSKKIRLVHLAKELGCTPSAISRFQTGLTSPSLTQVENLFLAIGYVLLPVDKDILPKL